jgi:hypothetical protein
MKEERWEGDTIHGAYKKKPWTTIPSMDIFLSTSSGF